MHWLIKCRAKPNIDAVRLATLDAHKNFLDGYPEVTWYSGPIFTDDDRNAIGSLRLIEFPDRAGAERYINADPYTKAGMFESITIERWKPVMQVRQRDYVRKEGTMQFVIHGHDRPDNEAPREPVRKAHHAYIDAHAGLMVTRGPLFDDSGEKMIGRVLIVDVADKREAETFWANEPYNRAGCYAWTTIERWRFGHV